MTKYEYMLEQTNLENRTEEIEIDIPKEYYDVLAKEAIINQNMSIEDFIVLILKEKLIELEVEKNRDRYPNIIDIYDLGLDPEKYIDEGKDYLVINPNGKHVMLLTPESYEEIKGVV